MTSSLVLLRRWPGRGGCAGITARDEFLQTACRERGFHCGIAGGVISHIEDAAVKERPGGRWGAALGRDRCSPRGPADNPGPGRGPPLGASALSCTAVLHSTSWPVV